MGADSSHGLREQSDDSRHTLDGDLDMALDDPRETLVRNF